MTKFIQILVFLAMMFAGFGANAQNGIITTVAGTSDTGFTGDGGAATAAKLDVPEGVAVDGSGNVYIADYYNYCIRKVNTSGIITTIAGNGIYGFSGYGGAATAAEIPPPHGVTVDGVGNVYIIDLDDDLITKVNTSGVITIFAGNGFPGYAGDGGAATAAELDGPLGVAVDGSGNVYIAEGDRIRKVNTSGIITTIAGNGSGGYSGDGGAATDAGLTGACGVAVDGSGNVYITDWGNNCIRKVNSSGVITTFAGNRTAGYAGDGAAATAAELYDPTGVAVDRIGNVYISDARNSRIRKVNSSGVITTIAGNGTAAYGGDGGAATAAELAYPHGVAVDAVGNVYIADYNNNRIRKVTNVTTVTADSFAVYVNNVCGGLQFELVTNTYSSGHHITTWFGNGSSLDTTTAVYGSSGLGNIYEPYTSSGVYTIKHVLYDGALAVDSVTYAYTVSLCQDFALGFYSDALGSCVYNDSADFLIPLPVLVEVDSNSIPIDTISATSGLYYRAYGNAGDIYTFRVISNLGGSYLTCPSSGSISDTLFDGSNTTKYFGFQCSSTASFDLGNISGAHTGRHMQTISLDASNIFCTNENATLNLTFSPQYIFGSAFPAPASVAGNIATWNLGELSMLNSNKNISVTLDVPGVWLTPGDTVQTQCMITPIIGDTDTLNNVIIRVDTVKSSWDPNEMSVSPSGCIHSDTATMLTYTVLFENTGNDTAHNIYIMDTLSDNLDPKSLRIVSASNTMNISKWYDSIHHNIYKFEFPHINLLDSSHHNRCDGMFIYAIKTKAGLPTGATIFNHAGIFFDDNAVVMTDITENVMNCPLSITNTPHSAPTPTLFPNPATSELTIHTPGNNYSSFIITNLMGQQQMMQVITKSETKVNIAALPAGVYFVTFSGEGGEVVKKFVRM